MNLVIFSIHCNEFLTSCSNVNSNIKYRKNFPQKTRQTFDRALRNLLDLVHEDNNYIINDGSRKDIHTAHQIIYLDKIHKQINTVLQNIYTLSGHKFFFI